jgi:hypothetical protein
MFVERLWKSTKYEEVRQRIDASRAGRFRCKAIHAPPHKTNDPDVLRGECCAAVEK